MRSKCGGWGEWIDRRRLLVGYPSQVALAAAVGCSRQHLSKWLTLTAPPKDLRRGYDAALCRVLRTDRHTLFAAFASIAPEAAPLTDAAPPAFDLAPLKRKVLAVVELLDADRLRELHERGRELLKQEMAASAA